MSLCNALSVWSLCNESVLCARCIPVRESKLVSRTHTHTSTWPRSRTVLKQTRPRSDFRVLNCFFPCTLVRVMSLQTVMSLKLRIAETGNFLFWKVTKSALSSGCQRVRAG